MNENADRSAIGDWELAAMLEVLERANAELISLRRNGADEDAIAVVERRKLRAEYFVMRIKAVHAQQQDDLSAPTTEDLDAAAAGPNNAVQVDLRGLYA